jgi:hypothetical protein
MVRSFHALYNALSNFGAEPFDVSVFIGYFNASPGLGVRRCGLSQRATEGPLDR